MDQHHVRASEEACGSDSGSESLQEPYIYIYTYIYVYVYIHTYTYTCTYAYCVCVYIYIYIYISLSIYIYRERERDDTRGGLVCEEGRDGGDGGPKARQPGSAAHVHGRKTVISGKANIHTRSTLPGSRPDPRRRLGASRGSAGRPLGRRAWSRPRKPMAAVMAATTPSARRAARYYDMIWHDMI